MSDREELVKVIYGTPTPLGIMHGSLWPFPVSVTELADAILASDWLAEHDAATNAEAWEEGFDSGERDVMNHNHRNDFESPCIANPYLRTETPAKD